MLMSKILAAKNRLYALVLSQRFGFKPSDIYGEDFYEREVNANQVESADAVADTLIEIFAAKTVIDIGCGNGLYLHTLSQRQVWAVGCDGSAHGVRLCPPDIFVFQYDLKAPLVTNRRFDLCLCFEVAEHIPKRYSGNLVQSCCNSSDTVVFSSAQVGQGGTDHINERSPEFWNYLFRKEGFEQSLGETNALQARFQQMNVVHWLTANTRVYRRVGGR